MAILLKDLNNNLYKQAHSQGMTLSTFLEKENPSPQGSKLDAFERLMMEAGILPTSNYSKNIFASNVEAFYRTDENKVLFPEYIARTLVRAMTVFPAYDALVASRSGIDSNVYSATYLDFDDPANKRALQMRRVTEGADLPTATLKLGKNAIQFSKFGMAIKATYEATRRMSLDLLSIHINAIGTYAADNKVTEILYTIIDGDGNNNAAPIIKSRDLDSSATTVITKDAWIKFLVSFYPYSCNTVVANLDGLLQILKVLYPAQQIASKMDELIATLGTKVETVLPKGLIAPATLLYNPNLDKIDGKEIVIGVNKENAIEEKYELGSTINEADKYIQNQTTLMTVSENSGFRKILDKTSKILSIG